MVEPFPRRSEGMRPQGVWSSPLVAVHSAVFGSAVGAPGRFLIDLGAALPPFPVVSSFGIGGDGSVGGGGVVSQPTKLVMTMAPASSLAQANREFAVLNCGPFSVIARPCEWARASEIFRMFEATRITGSAESRIGPESARIKDRFWTFDQIMTTVRETSARESCGTASERTN